MITVYISKNIIRFRKINFSIHALKASHYTREKEMFSNNHTDLLTSCDRKRLKYKFSWNLEHLFQTRVISSLAQSGNDIPRIRACSTITLILGSKAPFIEGEGAHTLTTSFFNLHNHHHHDHHHHLSKKEKMLMYSSNFSFDNPAAAWVTKQCNQDDENLRLIHLTTTTNINFNIFLGCSI